jgi:hypothetical protein
LLQSSILYLLLKVKANRRDLGARPCPTPRAPTDAGIQSICVTTFQNCYKVGEGIVQSTEFLKILLKNQLKKETITY